MADASVRPARAADAPRVAEVQLRTWREGYARLLPPGALTGIDPSGVHDSWLAAITAPPSPRHRVLVAAAGDDVVGFAATTPATDDDLDPAVTAELVTLLVDVGAQRQGHASRLLAACADHWRAEGATEAVLWLLAADGAGLAFYESAGWALDGATRDLEMGELVAETRLHTAL